MRLLSRRGKDSMKKASFVRMPESMLVRKMVLSTSNICTSIFSELSRFCKNGSSVLLTPCATKCTRPQFLNISHARYMSRELRFSNVFVILSRSACTTR